jgi:hypothetical protein
MKVKVGNRPPQKDTCPRKKDMGPGNPERTPSITSFSNPAKDIGNLRKIQKCRGQMACF